jgi:hypothetical protein
MGMGMGLGLGEPGKSRSSLGVERQERRRSSRHIVLHGLAEKDLRETTMLMGLEKEEQVRSEIILDRLQQWTPQG